MTRATIPVSKPLNLLGFDRPAMQSYFSEIGEKPFRAQQLTKWIHQQGVTEFDQMSNLSKALRSELESKTVLDMPEVVFDETSKDGTRKWVLQLDDGNRVETVFIPEDDRGTLCISSVVRWIAVSAPRAGRASTVISPAPRSSLSCGWRTVCWTKRRNPVAKSPTW